MLEENDIIQLKEMFISRQECEEKKGENDSHIADLTADVREYRTKLNMLIGILSAIAVQLLGIAAKLLFGGI